MKLFKAPPPSSAADQIKAGQQVAEKIIDAKVAEEGAECPGVPIQGIKDQHMNRNGGCPCRAALSILAED
jgi:hypothetical protein